MHLSPRRIFFSSSLPRRTGGNYSILCPQPQFNLMHHFPSVSSAFIMALLSISGTLENAKKGWNLLFKCYLTTLMELIGGYVLLDWQRFETMKAYKFEPAVNWALHCRGGLVPLATVFFFFAFSSFYSLIYFHSFLRFRLSWTQCVLIFLFSKIF